MTCFDVEGIQNLSVALASVAVVVVVIFLYTVELFRSFGDSGDDARRAGFFAAVAVVVCNAVELFRSIRGSGDIVHLTGFFAVDVASVRRVLFLLPVHYDQFSLLIELWL